MDATVAAMATKPVSGLDATVMESPEEFAETQLESDAFARGSGAPMPSKGGARALAPGTTIGRFIVTGELGAGGMGVVYAAYDPKLDRKVAIKMLHEGIRHSHRARLEREARAMAKLTHPNVVSVHEVGEYENRLFVAMEFVDGKTLRDWLAHEKPDRRQIMNVMIEAGRGLAAAHAAGMAHRDFKPDNVLVGKDGRARVSDFGLVTPVGTDTIDEVPAPIASASPSRDAVPAIALTQVGTIMGTPLYMAPEQHEGGATDHRADQFSFCVTLWEALYERTPYSAQSYEALVDNVVAGRIQPPPSANKGPKWIRNILTRGLSVDPAARFASMNDLLLALENDPWKFRRRLAAGAALLSLTGAAAFVLVFQGQDSSSAAAICQGAERQIDAIWTPERRSEIAKAFRGSDIPGALDAWTKSEQRLDVYASDWVKLRTESCEATHLHKEQSPKLLAFSMDCFDRRLLGFRSVVELFASVPNEHVFKNAGKTVGDMPDLQSCLNRSELERAVPLPENPEARIEIRKLQESYEQMKRHELRGEFTEALELATRMSGRADELGYSPLEADILIARGGFEQTLGMPQAAEATLRKAASAAARANDDAKVAGVWIRVLDLLVQQGRLDEALAIETVAVTSAERVPGNLAIQARLHNTLGGIFVAKARYDEAFDAYQIALDMQRAIGSENNRALAPAIANLGLAQWYRGNIQAAKGSFEEALELMLRDNGPDHTLVAYARKNIADLAIQLGNDDQAHEQYLEVLRIWTKTLGPKHANLGFAYEQLARIAQRAGDSKAAFEFVDKALKVREEALGPQDPLIVQSLSVAIEMYLAEGDAPNIARAEAAIDRALEIIAVLGETGTAQKIYILDSRAKLAEAREQWSTALADRETVLGLRRATLGNNHTDTAYSLAQVAALEMRMGDFKKSDKLLAEAQRIYDDKPVYGDGDGVGMRRSRAQLRIEQKRYEDAMTFLEEALEKAREGKDIERMIPLVQFEIAQLRYTMGEKDTALAEARAILDALTPDEQTTLGPLIEAWLKKR